ncbi:MAG: hypothetical protein WCG08_11480 [Paludibacter sp.]
MNYNLISEVPKNKLFIVHGYEYLPFQQQRRYTLCGILDNKKLYLGICVCHLDDDFKRKTGVEIAFERAKKSTWFVEVRTRNPREVRDFINSYAGYLIEKNLDAYKDINKEQISIDNEIENLFVPDDYYKGSSKPEDEIPF